MGKRSHRRPTSKEYPGCMGGFIRMFDFRNGRSTRKLISDRRRGNGRHVNGPGHSKSRVNLLTNSDRKHTDKDVTIQNSSDGNETRMAASIPKQTSVKALIDDEMSNVHFSKKQTPRTAFEHKIAEVESRDHKQTSKSCKVTCDLHLHDSGSYATMETHQSYHPNLTERTTLIEEEKHQNYKHRTGSFHMWRSSGHMNMEQVQKLADEDKLNEAMEMFLNQKFMDAKKFVKDGATHQNREFMDALEVLNSNKELFLKLLQDPNSLLVKHIQDLRTAQLDKESKEETMRSTQSEKPISHKQLQRQSVHNLFRRKEKIEDGSKNLKKGNDSSYASNRIVVLKPSLERAQNSTTMSPSSSPRSHYILKKEVENERATNQFSIREITRKLKNVIGESRKERNWLSMDGILHRTPYGHQHSRAANKMTAGKTRPSIENETTLHKSDNYINSETRCGYPQQRESRASEGRKHLAELQGTGDMHGDLMTLRVTRSFSRILSLPEQNMLSPRFSPGRDKEPTSLTPQMRSLSPHEGNRFGSEKRWHLKKEISAGSSSPLMQKSESSCGNSNSQASESLQAPNPNSEPMMEDSTVNNIHKNIGSGTKDGDRAVANIKHNIDVADYAGEEESFEHLRMDSSEKRPSQTSTLGSFTGSPLLIHKIIAPSISEKPERPSPVSVLEPVFTDGIVSPVSPPQAELALEPQPIHLEEQKKFALQLTTLEPEISPRTCTKGKEDEFEYVKTVMEASGFGYGEFIGRWHSSDQPLPPSLFDEIEASSAHLSNNRKLLFDCINEVLVEVYDQFFSCSPWISFVKTNIRPAPVGKHVIEEVWQGIDWNLLPQSPRALEQIMGKDMAKAGAWMDLPFDVECVGIEMGEEILEKIMEETILELWD